MAFDVSPYETEVSRWPLPLAQLYRRAQNAKTPLERHLAGFYLWEASLKLLASVAVVNYARREERDPSLTECLQHLVRPSLGHWWEILRRLTPVLADERVPGFEELRELLLGPRRDNLPRVAGLDAALSKALEGKEGARATVCLTELFDRLVKYRNKEVGHGAAGQRGDTFYDEMGRALQSGAAELFSRLDVLAGRRLIYIADVRQVEGKFLIQRFELHGENARRIESLERPRSEAARLPDGERVYLGSTPTEAGDTQLESLYPFLIYNLESNQAAFLNSRRGNRAKGKGRTAFLCYTTGQEKELADSGDEQRELLALVLEMGVSAQQAEQCEDQPSAEESIVEEGPAGQPRKLGEYELLSELGRGAMGVVYRAWQPSLGRQVALKKVLKVGDVQTEARFRREIRALGQVEHRNLVKIFTSGSDGDQWFYVMELVEGAPLDAVSDQLRTKSASATEVDLPVWRSSVEAACQEVKRAEKTLSEVRSTAAPPSSRQASSNGGHEAVQRGDGRYVERMLELMCQVAGAAHALHEHGVLHRDIKPGNIQVTSDGAEAVLMDLGLAQLADDVEGRLTRTRQFVGTLRYASPQQVLAVGTLDRRSDVYSLGATLWELLTLRPLFGAAENTPTPVLMEKIQREEPERLRKYNPGIPADVEAIVHKCLEKDPKRRYPTALALVDDLHRFLAGEPVEARPIRAWEQSLKWARRRPLAAALMVVAILAMASLLAGGVWFARAQEMRGLRDLAEQQRDEAQRQSAIATRERGEADRQSENARRQSDEADKQRAIAEKQRAQAEEQHAIAQQQRDLARRYQYGADMSLAHRAWQDHQYTRVLQLLARYQSPGKGETDFRGFEWYYLSRLCQSALLTLEGHSGKVWSVAFSPDGRFLASAGAGGVVILWDAADGTKIRQIQADRSSLRCVAFSPDSKLLATGGSASAVKLWNVADGKPAFALDGHTDEVMAVTFSSDGRWLASGSRDHNIKIWNLATRRGFHTLKGSTNTVLCAAFSPDSKRLVSGACDKNVRLWDVETGSEIRHLGGHTGNVNGVAFCPDGKRFASASDDCKAKVWNAETSAEVYSFDNGNGLVSGVAFSPDGTQLASTGDRTVTLWNLSSGNSIVNSRLHTDYLLSVAFSPDGTRLATGSMDRGLKIWDLTARPEAIVLRNVTETTLSAVYAPNRAEVAWGGGENGDLRIWDLEPEHAPVVLKGHKTSVMSAIYSPDGTRLATGESAGEGVGGTVKVWDTTNHAVIYSFQPIRGRAIRSLSFSSDGVRLAAAITADEHSMPGQIRVWDMNTGKETDHWEDPSGGVYGVAFSPDGKWLATGGFQGSVALRDASSGKVIRKISGHWQDVYRVVFSPDGRRLATSGADGTARVWDAKTLKEVFELQGHTNRVMMVVFSKDGNRIATASLDGSVKLWDAMTGQEILSLSEPGAMLFCAAYRPDGRQIATGGSGGILKIWDAETLAQESPALRRQILEKGWLAWHQEQAEPAETAKQWYALGFHVRFIAANYPGNGIWYRILAHADYEQENWNQTIEDATKAIQLKGESNDTWFYRASAYQSLSQWDLALADYSRGLKLAPRSWWLWFNRGTMYATLRQWTKAIDDYDKALALNPNYWKTRYKRGVAEAELEQWEKAVADLARAVALGERTTLVMGNLARAQLAHGETEGYRATCAAMIGEFGDTKDLSEANSVAWTCAIGPAATSDVSQALRLAEQAANGEAKGWAELNTLGSVLYRVGRYEEAIQRLNEGIKAHKQKVTAWDDLFLAMAHHQLGHADLAKQFYDKARQSIARGNPRNSTTPGVTPWDERAELKFLNAEADALFRAR